MGTDIVTGRTAKAAALRGLALGLVLQALLIAAIHFAGPPVDPGLVAISGPPVGAPAVTTLAQAHP